MDDGDGGNDRIINEAAGSKGSEIEDKDGDSRFSASGGIQDGMVEESTEISENVLRCPEPDSPTRMEVSGSGINLFVEVFGPLDGMSESNHDLSDKGEPMSRDGVPKTEENGVSSDCVKSENIRNGEGGVGEQEYTFDVSDLVWVKTRSGQWWPGIVSDPSDGVSDVKKSSEKRATFLVKYFGNANIVWCNNSELKPFVEHFDQMSRQVNSKNFVGSVEKALCEVGQRVKSEMTCQCFSKESQKHAVQLSLKHKTDALSASQFVPAGLVARIRHLALSVCAPDKVELTVMKNRLSAFYCSIGVMPDEEHKNISGRRKSSVKIRDVDHYVLRRAKRNSSDDTDRVHDDKMTSSRNTSESRERKKSKYLSYPYVGVKSRLNSKPTAEKEAEDLEHQSKKSSTPRGRSNGTVSQKRGSRKPSEGLQTDVDNINASSAELLAELRSAARDCFFINHSLIRFYTSFRNFAFLDAEKKGKVSRHRQESDGEKSIPQNFTQAEAQGIEEVKVSKKLKVKTLPADTFSGNQQESNGEKSMNFTESEALSEGIKEVKTCKKLKVKTLPGDGEKCIPQNFTEPEVLLEGIKEGKVSRKRKASRESVKKTVDKVIDNQASETNDLQEKGNGRRGRAKKKKENVISTSSCVVTDEKDNPSSSCPITTQQACSDEPKNETVPEKKEGCAEQSTSNCLGIDKTDNPVISFQQTCSDAPKSETAPKKTMELDSVVPQTNTVSQLPDLNGNHPNQSIDQIPPGEPSADLGKPFDQGTEGLVSPNASGVQQMAFTSIPSKDTPTTILQNIPKFNNPVNGICQNEEFTAREPEPPNMTANALFISFVQPSLKMGPFPKPERKERKRKQKPDQVTSVIPDLNGNVLDTSSSGQTTIPEGIPISPDGILPQKRGKNKSTESGSNGKINEDLGGSLLLSFTPGSTLPSKETLVAKFSRFGLLKESEIQVIEDSSVQIVYERSSDAKFAFRSLEKSNPFGEDLTGFKLHCTAPASVTKPKKRNFQMPQPFSPLDSRKNPAKPGETTDLAVMRQNVEMMKLTLEKAGNNLSPEMRAKLENEIKNFLDKFHTMGSSSSS